VLGPDIVESHIADVESYVTELFEARRIDALSYTDSITALSEAALALARIGRPTAERPLRAASQAEARVYARWQCPSSVRHAVRAAVAAALCLVDQRDDRAATNWLADLATILPRRKKQGHSSRSGPHVGAARRSAHPARGLVPG